MSNSIADIALRRPAEKCWLCSAPIPRTAVHFEFDHVDGDKMVIVCSACVAGLPGPQQVVLQCEVRK
ncbi:MAG: hypothetical protein WCA78_00505 [Rhizomicrobium sp.]